MEQPESLQTDVLSEEKKENLDAKDESKLEQSVETKPLSKKAQKRLAKHEEKKRVWGTIVFLAHTITITPRLS